MEPRRCLTQWLSTPAINKHGRKLQYYRNNELLVRWQVVLVCSILGLDLLVCQVEGHGDLAEKWKMAILRCESVPGKVILEFFYRI